MQHPAFISFAQQYLAALLKESGTVFLNQMIPRDPSLRVYKHPSRSNFGTAILSEVIGEREHILISPEVIGEATLVDVLFEPHQSGDRSALGWLGQLVSYPSIVQVLRHSPNPFQMERCIQHWLCWRAEASGSIVRVDECLEQDDPNQDWDDEHEEPIEEEITKTMLILVPSLAAHMLVGFGLQPAPEYISGVYKFAPAFHITVGVINQLPIQTSTLWLRLLGRGPVQRQAIEEVMMAPDNPLRDRALQQLKAWYGLLRTERAGKESQRLMQTLAQLDQR